MTTIHPSQPKSKNALPNTNELLNILLGQLQESIYQLETNGFNLITAFTNPDEFGPGGQMVIIIGHPTLPVTSCPQCHLPYLNICTCQKEANHEN